MIKCSNCGLEFDDDTKLCPNCGNDLEGSKKVQEQKDEKSKKCPECGALVSENVVICPDCGNKIAEIKLFKKCPNCGSEIDFDAQFCEKCGINLNPLVNSVIDVVNVNINNLNGKSLTEMFSSINYVKLGVTTIISLFLSIILTFIFMFLVAATSSNHIPDYAFAFYLALIVAVGVIATYLNNIVEGGLLGLINGLLLGILESSIAGVFLGSSWGYELFFGDNTFGFIFIGVIVGILANKFLKEKFTEYIDLNQYI